MGRTTAIGLFLAVPVVFASAAGIERREGPTLVLFDRVAQAIPVRTGCTYVGGGNFDVQRPSPDTVVVAMIGAVVATGHPCGSSAVMDFDLTQAFEVVSGPAGGNCRLSAEAQLVGALRGGRIAAAAASAGATVSAGGKVVVSAGLPNRAVACGENLTVNDRAAPDDVTLGSGMYQLHTHCRFVATHPAGLRGKAASAEFAPEPALDPIWIGGPRDPFHGVAKKDFGFRVTLRISPFPGR